MSEPKISCEDVRIQLNGVVSGSGSSAEYWFWNQSIPSGSLWQIISGSDTYIRFLVGDDVMDSSDSNTVREIKFAEIDYACFRTLVLLAGGVIVEGFNWTAGVTVSQPYMLPAYRSLIDEFKTTAQNHIRALQKLFIMKDFEMPSIGETAHSIM
jgi:hypothetical protein